MKLRIVLVVAVVATAFGVGVSPSFAAMSCGQTITHSIKLHSNLHCTSSDGIDVGRSNITIDLNGFTISNPSTSFAGVEVNSFFGVVVKNGTIRGFNAGVEYQASIGGTVAKIRTINSHHAIRISGSEDTTIRSNTLTGGEAGIVTTNASHDLTVVNNKIAPGTGSGLRLNGVTNSYFAHNTITNGLDRAIYLLNGANFNDIYANVATNPTNAGVEISNSSDNLIDTNSLSKASEGIVINSTSPGDSTGNQLVDNTTSRSDGDGIHIVANATHTEVNGNTANANGGNGIEVDATDLNTVVSNNTANNNAGNGISLASNVNDGGGNKATGNANQDCVNASC